MKILHLSEHSQANAGPSQVIYNHSQEQLKAGFQIDILTPFDENTLFYPVPEGVNLIKCRKNYFARFLHYFSFDAIRFFQKHANDYDVIHIHGVWHFPGILPFVFKNKAKRIITVHGMLGTYSINKSKNLKAIFSLLFQKRIFKETSLVHALHEGELSEIDNYLGYRHRGAFVLPNGLDTSAYQNLPDKLLFLNKYHIGPDKKIILFMGRLDAKKGIDLLMPAFKSVLQHKPESRLILAGPDYGKLDYIQSYAAENDLSEKITITGNLTGEIKLAALSSADVFVLPSYSEGFSMAVLEALACGIPVVVSAHTGFSDEIAQSGAGKIADLNLESISSNLLEYLNDEEQTKFASVSGKKLVEENYELQKVAAQLISKLHESLA